MRLLERKTHGVQRVAPAADHALRRETEGRRRYIQMAPTDVTPQHRCRKPRAGGALAAAAAAESTAGILIPTDNTSDRERR